MKRLLFALILFSTGLWAQPLTSNVNVAPDCLVFFDFTAAPSNGAAFDNRFIGCDTWNVAYTNTGFTVLDLYFQDAPDVSGVPGTYGTFAGTVVSGVNPNVAITQASTNFKGYYPWLRVRLNSATGSGRVRGLMYGYRAQPVNYVIASVTIGAITANQGAPNTDANRWPFYLSDGANAQGTITNPLYTTPSTACTLSAPIELAPASVGNQQIVALTALKSIRVCSISFANSAAADIKLTQGTGVNCVTGTTDITGTYRNVLSAAIGTQLDPLTTGVAQALCLNSSTGVNIGGVILYDNF